MDFTTCYLLCFIFFREGFYSLINKYYILLAYVITMYYICSVISNEAKAQKLRK